MGLHNRTGKISIGGICSEIGRDDVRCLYFGLVDANRKALFKYVHNIISKIIRGVQLVFIMTYLFVMQQLFKGI